MSGGTSTEQVVRHVHIDRTFLLKNLARARRLVVEGEVHPEGAHVVDLCIRARRSNDLETFCLRELSDDSERMTVRRRGSRRYDRTAYAPTAPGKRLCQLSSQLRRLRYIPEAAVTKTTSPFR